MKSFAVIVLLPLFLTSCIIYQDRPIHYDAEAVDWTNKSKASIEEKNWSEAIRTASVSVTTDPSYPEAYVSRARAYMEKGFTDKALEDCKKALELDSNNNGAYNIRGLIYLRRGETNRAKNDLETACNGGLKAGCMNFKTVTGYEPREKVDFFLNRAEGAFNRRDWDGVIKYASEITDSEIALSVRAGAYANKGMLKEAISDCDRAIKINPDYPLSYNNKGFVLELKGEKKEALLNYEMACNLNMPIGCANMEKLSSAAALPK